MQVGFPYQYGQEGHAVAKTLWMANASVRMLLNKVVPFLVAKPAAMQLGVAGPNCHKPDKYDVLYREAVRSGDRTTAVLCTALGVVVLGLAKWLLL